MTSLEVLNDFGRCLNAQDSSIRGRGLILSGCREAAVVVRGSTARMEVSDLEARDTMRRACASTECSGRGGGSGVVVIEGALGRIERFVIAANALSGVVLAEGGELDLADGEISRNVIGANIQTEGFDANRVAGNVRYLDNERDVDARELPVPTSTPRLLAE